VQVHGEEGPAALAASIARACGDEIIRLNDYAWESVLCPGSDAARLALALSRSGHYCRALPGEWAFLNTLALAQVQNRLHAEALKTLVRSRLSSPQGGPHPSNLVFKAMAELGLGRRHAARFDIDHARRVAAETGAERDGETTELLREAERLLAETSHPPQSGESP
jgi:hypothetical protein